MHRRRRRRLGQIRRRSCQPSTTSPSCPPNARKAMSLGLELVERRFLFRGRRGSRKPSISRYPRAPVASHAGGAILVRESSLGSSRMRRRVADRGNYQTPVPICSVIRHGDDWEPAVVRPLFGSPSGRLHSSYLTLGESLATEARPVAVQKCEEDSIVFEFARGVQVRTYVYEVATAKR